MAVTLNAQRSKLALPPDSLQISDAHELAWGLAER